MLFEAVSDVLQMLDGLTVVRDAFARTVRWVSTARLRQSVLLDLVDEEDLDALAGN